MITKEKIIEIHDRIIEETGGTKGILNEADIDYIVYKVEGRNGTIEKVAEALEGITARHPSIHRWK